MRTTRSLLLTSIRTLIVAYKNGAAVRSERCRRCAGFCRRHADLGLAQGKPAVLVIVFRQPGANIIATVDHVRATAGAEVIHFSGD